MVRPVRPTSCITTRGNNSTPHRDPTDPPQQRGHKRKGRGTYANDRPPLSSISSRDTGEPRWWVCDHANRHTCRTLMADNIPAGSATLSTDEWQRDHGSHAVHASTGHSAREWARDDEGDGRRAVHGNRCEGAGTALRTSLRTFRGVHKRYLHLDVATYEAMVNTTRVTPLIRRMCVGDPSVHTGYT